jgi:signal transduction histidine kinase
MEAVIETLAAIHHHGEGVAELAHDARNMVTALSLYCDLLDEPGVLATAHRHYASELRLVAEGSRRLVEKLSLLGSGGETGAATAGSFPWRQGRVLPELPQPDRFSVDYEGAAIEDLREELLAGRNLLAAIAGPAIVVTAHAHGGALPVSMSGENLIRVLVNLVRNASESISGAGTVELTLDEQHEEGGVAGSMVLTVEDSGGGIAPELLGKVFEPGFTTHPGARGRRGLGLSITRSIVEAAGGRIRVENREEGGARFVIELPVAGRPGPGDQGTERTPPSRRALS